MAKPKSGTVSDLPISLPLRIWIGIEVMRIIELTIWASSATSACET